MIYQLAPLEGITSYVYRNAYEKHYGKIDEYFTPFISPHKDKTMNSKERKEVDPENNKNITLIPQILTNSSVDFLKTVEELKALGYTHVNLNFGCPSATVSTKKKGSGILNDLRLLESFLDEVFEKGDIKISIKTRIGYDFVSEWEDIFKIYQKFPLEELIIHPRIRQDFYKNSPNMEAFSLAYTKWNGKLVYNGNLFTPDSIKAFEQSYPKVYGEMFGRGFIAYPNLINHYLTGEAENPKRLKAFHDDIFNGYRSTMDGEKNALFRMKELWFYLAKSFEPMPKLEKQIKKCQKCQEYELIVSQIFNNVPLCKDLEENIVF